MHVGNLHLPRHVQVRRRAGKLRGKRHGSMHAEPAWVNPSQSFFQGAAFQVHLQVPSLAPWSGRTSQEKASEILGRAIGPRWRSPESQLYRAVRVWSHVQIGIVEVEPGFGIAEFEIHA